MNWLYWADHVEIQRRAASAWLALAEGERESAIGNRSKERINRTRMTLLRWIIAD